MFTPQRFLLFCLLPLLLLACSSSEEAQINEMRIRAERGDVEAQYGMAVLAYNGHGMPQDLAASAQWFTLAAKQNHSTAQFNLGTLYEQGKGVEQSFEQALFWYMLATQNGVEMAQMAVQRVSTRLTIEQQTTVINKISTFDLQQQKQDELATPSTVGAD